MREQLWTEDYDKMLSIVGEDNFDAGTDMSASEPSLAQNRANKLRPDCLQVGHEGLLHLIKSFQKPRRTAVHRAVPERRLRLPYALSG